MESTETLDARLNNGSLVLVVDANLREVENSGTLMGDRNPAFLTDDILNNVDCILCAYFCKKGCKKGVVISGASKGVLPQWRKDFCKLLFN